MEVASAPRAPRKLADIVYEQLFRLIARGEFPKGLKLPPEGALAQRFGVSRPVIRDALLRPSMSNAVATITVAVLLIFLAGLIRMLLLIRQFAPSVAMHRDRAEFG